MINNPTSFDQAKRKNQAYHDYYGTHLQVNSALTRSMASDKVVARRSWYPTFATSQWFSSLPFMTKHQNVAITKGRDMKNENTFRTRNRPGELARASQFGTITNFPVVPANDDKDTSKIIYIVVFVFALIFISLLL